MKVELMPTFKESINWEPRLYKDRVVGHTLLLGKLRVGYIQQSKMNNDMWTVEVNGDHDEEERGFPRRYPENHARDRAEEMLKAVLPPNLFTE